MKFSVSRASHIEKKNPHLPPSFSVVKEGNDWLVEIETIDRLRELIDSQGGVVIRAGLIGGYYRIMIYDDYVE